MFLNRKVNALLAALQMLDEEEQDGCLNYAISRILNGLYPRKYVHMNRAVGVLEACKLEYVRRVLGPYEDVKIAENGDVYN